MTPGGRHQSFPFISKSCAYQASFILRQLIDQVQGSRPLICVLESNIKRLANNVPNSLALTRM
jgi:hypothetical protein